MAQAVQELYPDSQVTIGPVIDDGFYYDFAREEPFTTDDFEKPSKRRCHEIVKRDYADRARGLGQGRSEARRSPKIGEDYKVQIIDDIIPEGEEVSVYRQGDWFDVCRGPHLPIDGQAGPKASS
jgi:threonyl-tRNA synthetase